MKKRDRKFAAAFHVPPKAKAKWDIAVREAEEAMGRTRYVTRKYYISTYHMLQVLCSGNHVVYTDIACSIMSTKAAQNLLVSCAELNDCKILQDCSQKIFQSKVLRPTVLHAPSSRNMWMIRTTASLQKWLVLQNSTFIQENAVITAHTT